MPSTSVFNYTDFRGGYFTDVPSEQMKDTELLQAENLYWRNGLQKRLGKASYCSITGTGFRGGIRAKLASVWYTIVGMDFTASGVQFLYGTDTAFATLSMASSTAYAFQTGYDCQFAVLDERVVVVNGYNKPGVLRVSASSVFMDDLERYDTRSMSKDNWYAGQYVESSTSYADDTTDAQSLASTDFIMATTTVTAGFWVACDNAFNKVTLHDCQGNATGSMTFEYYGRASSGALATWVSFAPIDVPTWTGVGNKIIEMPFPIDSNTNEILLDSFPSSTYNIAGRYCMRFRNGNPSSNTWSCGYLSLDHTQYLSQLLLNDRPDTVGTHKSHLVLGMGNWMRMSPLNSVKGWREPDKQYFTDGGSIQAFVPHLDYLAILLENAIYGLMGNSWSNFSVKLLTSGVGPVNKRSACVVNEEIYFVGRKGIYGWNGSRLLKLSKHIQTDIDSYTKTNACAVNYNGEYWASFPSSSVVLLFDPDSLRIDDSGDGRMSFYKFTGYQVNQFLNYSGDTDNGYLMALVNGTNNRLDRCETGTADVITASATIPMYFQSRYMDFGAFQLDKVFRRIKPQVADSSTTAGAIYTMKMYRLDRYGYASSTATLTASVGSGIHTQDITVPPGMDGKVISVYLAHDSQAAAKIYGFAIEVEKGKY